MHGRPFVERRAPLVHATRPCASAGSAALSEVSNTSSTMVCERCGGDRLVLTFAPGSREPAGLLCLACGAWLEDP